MTLFSLLPLQLAVTDDIGDQLEKNGTVCELLATKLQKLVLYKHPHRAQPYSVTSAISRSKRNPV